MKKFQSVRIGMGVLCVLVLVYASVGFAENSGAMATSEEKYSTFLEETLDMRKDLAAKRFEIQNEMLMPEPDRAKIVQLNEEIYEIQTLLENKAKQAGVDSRSQGVGCGCGGGVSGFKS